MPVREEARCPGGTALSLQSRAEAGPELPGRLRARRVVSGLNREELEAKAAPEARRESSRPRAPEAAPLARPRESPVEPESRAVPRVLELPERPRRWLVGLGWAAAVLVAALGGYLATVYAFPARPSDRDLVRELRIIENLRYYEAVEPMPDEKPLKFLEELARPELFGEDGQDS